MTSKLKFIDLFAGIGGFRIAFESAGCECVFASEIDKFARHTYSANFLSEPIPWREAENIKDHDELFGDIRKVKTKDIPEFDILTAGFPCPTFSLAGVSKRKSLGMKHGLEDEEKGQLFLQIKRIISEKNKYGSKPHAFLLENVKNILSHNNGKTFEVIKEILEKELGYDISWGVMDAAKLVPQHRERVFIAGFNRNLKIDFNINEVYNEIKDKQPKLKNILDTEVDDKYFISVKLWQYLKDYKKKHRKKGNGFGFSIADKEHITRTMSARYYKDGSEILINEPGKDTPRMLTVKEASKLFGFPDDFNIPVSRTQAYKQFGNTVCVPLVKRLAKAMVKVLKESLKINKK